MKGPALLVSALFACSLLAGCASLDGASTPEATDTTMADTVTATSTPTVTETSTESPGDRRGDGRGGSLRVHVVDEVPDNTIVVNTSDPRLANLTIIDELAEGAQCEQEGVASENLSPYGADRITAELEDVPYYDGNSSRRSGHYVRSDSDVYRVTMWFNA